ncbi:UDP-N-acetylglucosamine 2-epimerase [Paenisporosarcina quisquiliarum]|uniref:UDP-N-acetylglucosamine 2-epimerase n=1 Tax=Paenisporosarcina quisquiliarum TaxID=365346 RepID=A0A9X3LGE0_9BACL|nr:UDP-N-acetylglucosamine 2-epimerase [Paenisporosarcina quisquiliarum]
MKKIVFLTGTRADYGKLKSLMIEVEKSEGFELHIFVTGMHMLSKYGSTYIEIEKDSFNNIYKFVNTKVNLGMDITLSNTIVGFSNYISEFKPDLIVVHGDRIEALAGSIVGALNNIKVAHIEGGEISGTIDESIRHAVTKFSHLHFVANEEAKKHVIQLGEKEDEIYVIGSPDIDIMFSKKLPSLSEVKNHYGITYDEYAIFMYHPVTTELDKLVNNISEVVEALIDSKKNYIVIFPNNDEGSGTILHAYNRLENNKNFKLYPSIRFEAFLVLLKNAQFMVGNSSAGIREAGIYNIPTIDIGSRQDGRYNRHESTIIHVNEKKQELLVELSQIFQRLTSPPVFYGDGESASEFIKVLKNPKVWNGEFQKKFIPYNSQF